MREKAATPAIRFKEFTEAWEQRKLGEVVGVYDGVHQTPHYTDNGVMFLSVENITTLISKKFISEEAFEKDYKVDVYKRQSKSTCLCVRASFNRRASSSFCVRYAPSSKAR